MLSNKIEKDLYKSKPYIYLKHILFTAYIIFMLVYMLREKIYTLKHPYMNLFAWVAPNLIPSFIFTLLGVFYIIPIFNKTPDAIMKPKILWGINVLNIIIFAIIEYLHVVFDVGVWDHKDMIASLIGMAAATVLYYRLRKNLKL